MSQNIKIESAYQAITDRMIVISQKCFIVFYLIPCALQGNVIHATAIIYARISLQLVTAEANVTFIIVNDKKLRLF